MSIKSAVTAGVVALTVSCPAWAADSSASATVPAAAPLAPGQAAGIKQAEGISTGKAIVIVGGLAVLGTGIALLASDNDHSTPATSTTSTTSTTGTH